MGLTTDRSDPGLKEIKSDGQQVVYLVLSEEERAKGFVMPLHRKYTHLACGSVTDMGLALCETYARNPKFYSGTFCCGCGTHFRLKACPDCDSYGGRWRDKDWQVCPSCNGKPAWTFEWPDGTPVGANVEETQAYLKAKEPSMKFSAEGKSQETEDVARMGIAERCRICNRTLIGVIRGRDLCYECQDNKRYEDWSNEQKAKETSAANFPHLAPLSREAAEALENYTRECEIEDAKPRTGGLISPPEPACVHDWQAYRPEGRQHTIFRVKRCSKCHVLGDPP